jgi:hypothetical protein
VPTRPDGWQLSHVEKRGTHGGEGFDGVFSLDSRHASRPLTPEESAARSRLPYGQRIRDLRRPWGERTGMCRLAWG